MFPVLLTLLMISICYADPETISIPSFTGPSTAIIGKANTYIIITPAVSSLGDSIQYQFDWGKVQSQWFTSPSYPKAWNITGVYQVKLQARCTKHPTILSPWSKSLTVSVSKLPIKFKVLDSKQKVVLEGTVTAINFTSSDNTLVILLK